MKKITALFIILFACVSCGNSDDSSYQLTNKAIDISDFAIYVGSPTGGVEVKYNNLKKADLVRYYFGSNYQPLLYDEYAMEFNEDKLTYVYTSDSGLFKIISGYIFKEDSLFVIKADGALVYAALGTEKNKLYRKQSLARYPFSAIKDTIIVSDRNTFDLSAMLGLMDKSNLVDLTEPSDTLVWCNIDYIFK